MALPASAPARLSVEDLKARFRPGARRIGAQIGKALSVLVRDGWAVETGGRFAAQVRGAALGEFSAGFVN